VKGPDYIFQTLFVKPVLTLYLRRDRTASYDGFKLHVKKGVFHPLLFFSTKILYEFISRITLANKSFLEIGSGSGMLSLLAKRKGAAVTAVDIDPAAVETTRINFLNNFGQHHGAEVLRSDVFSNVPACIFDVIVINPPYYFKDPGQPSEQAWFCGKEGQYFEKLFSGLHKYSVSESQVYMILEENCEIARINSMAATHGVEMEKVFEKKRRWERSFIYRLRTRSRQ
jgi:release factor glutamine methyltransferase